MKFLKVEDDGYINIDYIRRIFVQKRVMHVEGLGNVRVDGYAIYCETDSKGFYTISEGYDTLKTAQFNLECIIDSWS